MTKRSYGKRIRDPRKQGEYPDPRKAAPTLWAWEFLRRNPDYQADWEAFSGWARSIIPGYQFGRLTNDQQRMLDEHAAKGARTVTRPDGTQIQNAAVDRAYAYKWGITIFFPYDIPYPFEPTFFDSPGWVRFSRNGAVRDPHIIAITFDLRRLVPQQIEDAQGHLQREQKELVKRGIIKMPVAPRASEYRRYLRALDAKGEGLTHAETAKILHVGDNQVHEILKRARELRDNFGYLDLTWLSKKGKSSKSGK